MTDSVFSICESLSEVSKQQLGKLFEDIIGKKDLVLHPLIIAPLEKICDAKWLRSKGIEKIYKINLEAPVVQYDSASVIYLTFECTRTLQRILDEIQTDCARTQHKYHIVHVPQTPYNLDSMLEMQGIFEHVKTHRIQWMPLHLETGLLSLEMPNVYRSLFVEQDKSMLPVFSRALWQLHQVFGSANVNLAVGVNSCAIRRQLDVDIRTWGAPMTQGPKFDSIIVLDRSVDYVSALLTPTSYSALLADCYRPRCGVCEYKSDEDTASETTVDAKCVPKTKYEPVKIVMDSYQDKLYDTLKYKPFSEAVGYLVDALKQLAAETGGFKNTKMTVQDMRGFVTTKMKWFELAKRHDRASETIIRKFGDRVERRRDVEMDIINGIERHEDYIQELLITSWDRLDALRLFCLANVCNPMSAAKVRTFLDTYLTQHGYHQFPLYRRLVDIDFIVDPQQSAGLAGSSSTITAATSSTRRVSELFNLSTRSNFPALAAKFKQLPVEQNQLGQSDKSPSYVFGGGYVPLVVQLVSSLATGNSEVDLTGKLKMFGAHTSLHVSPSVQWPLRMRTFLIVMVGGVTYSEVAALRRLETITGATIVVCSDRMTTGFDLVESLVQ